MQYDILTDWPVLLSLLTPASPPLARQAFWCRRVPRHEAEAHRASSPHMAHLRGSCFSVSEEVGFQAAQMLEDEPRPKNRIYSFE
jgi:hypothetical protein